MKLKQVNGEMACVYCVRVFFVLYGTSVESEGYWKPQKKKNKKNADTEIKAGHTLKIQSCHSEGRLTLSRFVCGAVKMSGKGHPLCHHSRWPLSLLLMIFM